MFVVPFDCAELCQGRRSDGETGTFYIRTSSVDKIIENGPIWKFRDIQLIPDAVQNPFSIYEHLGREECDAACCYCAKPSHRIIDENTREEAPAGQFFVVYAEPIAGGMVVWDWGWRPEDKDSPSNPAGWESFGRGKVWPKP